MTSIIVTTELKSAVVSEAVISNRSVAITILPTNFGESLPSKEFVFIVDCSGSMTGIRIRRARECLQLFIRSLPPGSFFDIIRFGSEFASLFRAPAPYDDRHVSEAMALAANMQANLGGTALLPPLMDVFRRSPLKGGTAASFRAD